ncbi:MAG: ArnT family glycosyltransferase, partial [Longimicrobiales bacterium]
SEALRLAAAEGPNSTRRITHQAALGVMALVFVLVSLQDLTVLPIVGEDEPWAASASYKLAQEGVFGSDLFAGHHNAEKRIYFWPPLYYLGVAASFVLFGVGVVQMRLPAVASGLAILLLTYVLGRQIGGARLGLLAAALRLVMRIASGWNDTTGIPLVDLARVSRYDILVPVFGLLALWTFNRAEDTRRTSQYVATGVLIGLAALSHLYGAFVLPALIVIQVLRRGFAVLHERGTWAMSAGALLPWIPVLVYVAIGWEDFVAQQQMYADRYRLLDPRFYLSNLRMEIYRYRLLAPRDLSGLWFVRQFGTWVGVFGVPISLGTILASRQRNEPAFALAVALIVQGLLNALLLRSKMYNYIIALWPLAVILLAWLALRSWDAARWRGVRAALAFALFLVAVEGVLRIAHRHDVARRTTPYDDYTRRVAAHIPSDSRVLGLQHYWLGLRQFEYRSWLLPIFMVRDPATSLSLDDALERVRPKVVLVDRHMGGFFEGAADPSNPYHADYVGLQRFLARHEARLDAVVRDSTYGDMRVYRVR